VIVVCGGLADTVIELVCARLEARRLPYRFLDLGVYPDGFSVSWRWDDDAPTGWISGDGWRLPLEDIGGVFVRYPGTQARVAPAGVEAGAAAAVHAEHDFGISALLDALPCTVVNRIAEGMSNHSKPLQTLLIRAAGLAIPETLVTSDPASALRFIDECAGDVVFKSLSGIRSMVQRVGPRQLERLSMLRDAPAQFQRYVPGDNVRVHTVGDALFATLIRSDIVDYRYARRLGGTVEMEPTAIPDACAESCFAITRRLGLAMAGIDLKRTPAGDYYCFEVNPSPGFLYYEQHGGQPISDAVADLLAGIHHPPHPGGQHGRAEKAGRVQGGVRRSGRPAGGGDRSGPSDHGAEGA
jgi:glutathione synthase/RimK-type ligase-like ATP-grasp enzyme